MEEGREEAEVPAADHPVAAGYRICSVLQHLDL
jgi:hypothetical protein